MKTYRMKFNPDAKEGYQWEVWETVILDGYITSDRRLDGFRSQRFADIECVELVKENNPFDRYFA